MDGAISRQNVSYAQPKTRLILAIPLKIRDYSAHLFAFFYQ